MGRIAVAVADGTRSVDTPAALTALRGALDAIGCAAQVDVLVGLGLHRPMSDDELAPLRAASRWPVHNHEPDSCVLLGEYDGVPGWVHPIAARADLRICIGIVELHQFAGFSGGHKGVVVGLGGRDTLAELHSRSRVCDSRVVVGRLRGNPFRGAIDGLGRQYGPTLALQQLPDRRWLLGHADDVLGRATSAMRPWFDVHRPHSSCVLRVPRKKAVNLYQACRAATYIALSPSPPLSIGATLILDAACPEGAGQGSGEQGFAALMKAFRGRLPALLTDPVPAGAGLQRAFMLARLAEHYELVVAGCDAPEKLQALGIHATSRPATEVAPADALVVEQPFVRLPQLVPAKGRSLP